MHVLCAEKLTKVYTTLSKQKVLANDSISIKIRRGEKVGILGPNGSGKSTFIRQVIGFLPPTRGTLNLFGLQYKNNGLAIRQRIGYLMQNRYSHWDHLTIRQALACAGQLKGLKKKATYSQAEYLLESLGLKTNAHRMIRGLSGGNQQAACIAVTLMGTPEFIILDEPSTGLDLVKQKQLWEAIEQYQKKYHTTLLLVSHNTNEVERVCDRAVIIEKGRIIEDGTISDIKKRLSEEVRIEMDTIDTHDEVFPSLKIFKHYRYYQQGTMYILYCKRNEIPQLLQDLVENNIIPKTDGFRILNPSLEDAYISIVGRKMD